MKEMIKQGTYGKMNQVEKIADVAEDYYSEPLLVAGWSG